MKKILLICVLLIAATVCICVLLTSCGDPEIFESVTVTTTEKPTEEKVTYKYSDYQVFGARMGMDIEEVKASIGRDFAVQVNDTGIVFFITEQKGLPFTRETDSTLMYYIFDGKARLAEIQYASSTDNGFVLNNALVFYDSQYGPHAEYSPAEGKMNYIWYKGGVYILITSLSNGENAMSFIGEDYFKDINPEEAEAYARFQGGQQ